MEQKPKYIQIEEDIARKIKDETFKTNEKLPSEFELSKQYNVSRTTIVKALHHLESRSLIYKKRGSGSFVSPHLITKTFNQSRSFTDDMLSIGEVPSATLIDYQLRRASEIDDIKNILRLEDDDWIHYFVRVRLSNDTKVALSYDYVSARIIPKIDVNSLNLSFYKFLKDEYNIKPISTNYQINALISDDNTNSLLDIKDEPLLSVAHSSHLETGEIFKYNKTLYLGNKFCYQSGSIVDNNDGLLKFGMSTH